MSDSSQPHGLQPTRLLCPWDFPGKSTGVGAIAFSYPVIRATFTTSHKQMGFQNYVTCPVVLWSISLHTELCFYLFFSRRLLEKETRKYIRKKKRKRKNSRKEQEKNKQFLRVLERYLSHLQCIHT